MEIGELTSKDLTVIFTRLTDLEEKFENFCRQHNREVSTTISLGPKAITLKCFIK